MMKFTNADDLGSSATRFGLAGWYAQDSSGDYLGVLRKVDDEWFAGYIRAIDLPFPVTVDSIPK